MLKIKVLGEIFREAGTNTRCFIKDLNALDCRAGCMICVLEKCAKRMTDGFPSTEEGPGEDKSIKIVFNRDKSKSLSLPNCETIIYCDDECKNHKNNINVLIQI